MLTYQLFWKLNIDYDDDPHDGGSIHVQSYKGTFPEWLNSSLRDPNFKTITTIVSFQSIPLGLK